MKLFRKKIAFLLAWVLVITTVFAGCGSSEDQMEYTVYLINGEENGLQEETREITADTTDQAIEALTALLNNRDSGNSGRFSSESGENAVGPLFPEGVSIEQYSIENGNLSLWFSESYNEMSKVREILCRDGVVQEMLQIPEVNSVTFYVGGEPLKDSNGNQVGMMTADTFVTNPNRQLNSIQEATIMLYFADSTGQLLVPEEQTVRYVSSVSIEKLIVQQLIKGPDVDELQRTVPSDTRILNVTISEGTCYVNLSDGFLTQNYDVSEEVVIYSIVDSLCQLSEVREVRISVDGSSDYVYRENISLNQAFHMNQAVISADATPVQTEVTTTGE